MHINMCVCIHIYTRTYTQIHIYIHYVRINKNKQYNFPNTVHSNTIQFTRQYELRRKHPTIKYRINVIPTTVAVTMIIIIIIIIITIH
jgi:hypothetical protein